MHTDAKLSNTYSEFQKLKMKSWVKVSAVGKWGTETMKSEHLNPIQEENNSERKKV